MEKVIVLVTVVLLVLAAYSASLEAPVKVKTIENALVRYKV